MVTKPKTRHETIPFLNEEDRNANFELRDIDDSPASSLVGQSEHNRFEQLCDHDGGDHIDNTAELSSHMFSGTSRKRKSVPHKLLSYVSKSSRFLLLRSDAVSSRKPKQKSFRLPILSWRVLTIPLILLGIVQLITLVFGVITAFFPEHFDHAFRTWRHEEHLDDLSRWPTDYTADILPVACHSHNDYWRRIPLKSAIKAGCISVEADVWLSKDDLYVGHSESALTVNRTLNSLYINPLIEILDRQNPTTGSQTFDGLPLNGVFDTNPLQTLVLLIDFKTDYERLWPMVAAQLEPLRQRKYLAYFNGTAITQGPVTVVVTGNAPFDEVVLNMHHRDMFFDSPLDRLASLSDSNSTWHFDQSLELDYIASLEQYGNTTKPVSASDPNKDQRQGYSGHPPENPAIFTPMNSYYASVDFQASIGWPKPYLSLTQRERIAAQIAGAHVQGLKVRYWNVPNWPVGLRNYLWRELVKMGVDVLNVDDLYSATKGDWSSGYSIWDWSLWGGRDW